MFEPTGIKRSAQPHSYTLTSGRNSVSQSIKLRNVVSIAEREIRKRGKGLPNVANLGSVVSRYINAIPTGTRISVLIFVWIELRIHTVSFEFLAAKGALINILRFGIAEIS